MATFTLPTGRPVYLTAFALESPYRPGFDGSPGGVRAAMLRSVATRVRPGVVLLDPGPRPVLPRWLCRASLFAYPAVRAQDDGACSELTILWFTSRLTRSVERMVGRVLTLVDWDAAAVDVPLAG